jgi:hypothetical protein
MEGIDVGFPNVWLTPQAPRCSRYKSNGLVFVRMSRQPGGIADMADGVAEADSAAPIWFGRRLAIFIRSYMISLDDAGVNPNHPRLRYSDNNGLGRSPSDQLALVEDTEVN